MPTSLDQEPILDRIERGDVRIDNCGIGEELPQAGLVELVDVIFMVVLGADGSDLPAQFRSGGRCGRPRIESSCSLPVERAGLAYL
jgi:hypothetical protein